MHLVDLSLMCTFRSVGWLLKDSNSLDCINLWIFLLKLIIKHVSVNDYYNYDVASRLTISGVEPIAFLLDRIEGGLVHDVFLRNYYAMFVFYLSETVILHYVGCWIFGAWRIKFAYRVKVVTDFDKRNQFSSSASYELLGLVVFFLELLNAQRLL